MTMRSNNSGFTLVEVMVALLIVAVAISALLFRMMTNIDNTAYLRDKAIAQWVAMNQLTELRLRNRHSNSVPDREQEGSEQQLGHEWYWRAVPKKTAAEGFVQIAVAVYQQRDDQEPLVTVTGLLDQYHREQ
jgi:general secretion pathway protein I